MIRDGKVWIANTKAGEPVFVLPKMANRHGLIAGATGTGKTITLKVMAESFSDMGVPVFLADVKGDIAGMINAGKDSEDMQKRIEKFGLAANGFSYHNYPVTLWDVFGKNGIQVRTTITEMGPLLLSRILDLNENQSSILSIVFKIADENNMKSCAIIILIGKMFKEIGFLNKDVVNDAVKKVIPAKKAAMIELNLKAIEIGLNS